jgi:hypothetical protein
MKKIPATVYRLANTFTLVKKYIFEKNNAERANI